MRAPDRPAAAAAAVVPPRPTPSISSPGPFGFTVACSTTIAAPPLLCLATVLDTAAWPAWNTFCTAATIHSTHPPDHAAAAAAALDAAPELRALAARPAHLHPGVAATFSVIMTPGAPPTMSGERVTLLERIEQDEHDGPRRRGYRVAWRFDAPAVPHLLLHAERVQEFVEVRHPDHDDEDDDDDDDDDAGHITTEYLTYETFGGLLSPVLRWLKAGQVCDGFDRWATSLKKAAEASAAASEGHQGEGEVDEAKD